MGVCASWEGHRLRRWVTFWSSVSPSDYAGGRISLQGKDTLEHTHACTHLNSQTIVQYTEENICILPHSHSHVCTGTKQKGWNHLEHNTKYVLWGNWRETALFAMNKQDRFSCHILKAFTVKNCCRQLFCTRLSHTGSQRFVHRHSFTYVTLTWEENMFFYRYFKCNIVHRPTDWF